MSEERDEMVKSENGKIVHDDVEVRRRWTEYSEQVEYLNTFHAPTYSKHLTLPKPTFLLPY